MSVIVPVVVSGGSPDVLFETSALSEVGVLSAELKGIDEVRRARRAVVRSVSRMAAGELGHQEVDVARMLFGETAAEEKLANFGLLDDGGLLDRLVYRIFDAVVEEYDGFAPVAELSDRIEDRILELQRGRAEAAERGDLVLPNGLPRKVPRPGREDVAERNARTSRRASARLLAVHLAQRALYEGLNMGLAELVRRQAAGEVPRSVEPDVEKGKLRIRALGHGSIAMGPDHVASADAAISRMRKEHMAGHPPRGYVPMEQRLLVPVSPPLEHELEHDPGLRAAMGMAPE